VSGDARHGGAPDGAHHTRAVGTRGRCTRRKGAEWPTQRATVPTGGPTRAVSRVARTSRGGHSRWLGDNGGVTRPTAPIVLPRLALTGWLSLALVTVLAPARVLAHGGAVPPELTLTSLLFSWSFDATIWLPVAAAAILWRSGVTRVNARHPGNPVPRRRTIGWMAGLGVLLVALDSGVERYDTTLFSMHMVQHLLLTMVAAPLLLYAGPITLLMRASGPATRRRWILPLLHARPVRVISHPVVAWILFAGVMWASHFSPLFNAALEDELIHRFEHALFLGSAALFWWPVVGPDPSPWRMRYPARILYVGLQMPQNTFLALAIYSATEPLYPHYATVERDWGPTPLFDQQVAGGIMWLGGDLLFLAFVALLVAAWFRDEERRLPGEDRRLQAERAAIRERSERLAERRAAEQASEKGGGGDEAPSPAPGAQPSGGIGASR
jgi:putative membrane protein